MSSSNNGTSDDIDHILSSRYLQKWWNVRGGFERLRAQFYQVSLVVEEDGKPLTSSEVDKKLDVSDKVWSTVMHPYERFKDAPLAAGNTGQNNKGWFSQNWYWLLPGTMAVLLLGWLCFVVWKQSQKRGLTRLQIDYVDASNRSSTVFSNPIYTANFGEQQLADVITVQTEPDAVDHLLDDTKPDKTTSLTTFTGESEA
ncbi:hypothetical protein BSL78_25814 [Apostichopus japonicus]|uniref:Transmembrane protein n=1 Tax=Stichopus japonicus TaxID=307972 RepID=A0A2G8JNP8_STIJA|nr:hypothetical protein BSL78_25814 [Apostichopus japonicus]